MLLNNNAVLLALSLSGKTLSINFKKNIVFTVAYKRTTTSSETFDSNQSLSLAVDGVTFCPPNSNLAADSTRSPVPWVMM